MCDHAGRSLKWPLFSSWQVPDYMFKTFPQIVDALVSLLDKNGPDEAFTQTFNDPEAAEKNRTALAKKTAEGKARKGKPEKKSKKKGGKRPGGD